MASRNPIAAGRDHLNEVGMGYGAHLRRASRVGSRMLAAGGACMVHGLFPNLFCTTATRTIVRLNQELQSGPAHGKREPALLEFEI